MSRPVVLCTACNHTYALGGCVAVCSALLSLKAEAREAGAVVYVLDGGLKPDDWSRFERSVAACGASHRLVRLLPKMAAFAGLPQDWGSSVMTYARLALPELVEEDRLLYIDADMVVQRDLSPFMDLDLEGCIVAASRDVVTERIGAEHLPVEKYALDPEAPYFQAGFLVIDLPAWKRHSVSGEVLRYLRENPGYAKYWDQSALNVVLHRRWKQLEDTWNSPAWWADMGRAGCSLDDAILHFVGPHKPWLRGHHRSGSAKRFFSMVDRTAWRGWRPTFLRQLLKQARYEAGKLLTRRH